MTAQNRELIQIIMFKIGDRVRAVKAVDGKSCLIGKIGTVIVVDRGIPPIGVEFDEEFKDGHTCGKGKSGYCRWGNEYEFELLTSATNMQTLTSTLKRILSPSLQTLYKAGFIDGGLELTDEGKKECWAIMQKELEEQLVSIAKEKLEEKK